MPKYTNVSGVWKEEANGYVNVSGVWKTKATEYVNVSGVWKEDVSKPFGDSYVTTTTNTSGVSGTYNVCSDGRVEIYINNPTTSLGVYYVYTTLRTGQVFLNKGDVVSVEVEQLSTCSKPNDIIGCYGLNYSAGTGNLAFSSTFSGFSSNAGAVVTGKIAATTSVSNLHVWFGFRSYGPVTISGRWKVKINDKSIFVT